ncbi:MAG: hypothetical protein VW082_09585 [Candidatus Nanopelagicales bacterium]|jgi:hypothetical protein
MSVLLVHGAGSSGAAALALLGDCLAPFGRVQTLDDRTGDVGSLMARLDTVAPHVDLAVGVSLGAHALARWAAGRPKGPALLLCLPAWTGEPDEVARATEGTAQRLTVLGRQALLQEMPDDAHYGPGRVADLVRLGWGSYGDRELVDALAAAAHQRGPTTTELATIITRTAVLGWPDDALHPDAVARLWAKSIPAARYFAAHSLDPIALRRACHQAIRWLAERH